MTVYCNITECKNWLPLTEIKHMEHKPGFTPIGKTDEYYGQCTFKSIEIKSTTANSRNTKQVLAICGNYNTDQSPQFICNENRCTHFIDPKTCSKVKYDENLYINWTIAFDGTEKKNVPRCKSFAHRRRENAFDSEKAAVPGRW